MCKLGVPVSDLPWEAPEDGDVLGHWLSGVRPWAVRKFIREASDRGVARGPREALWRDARGREWWVRE